jgi:hypothetical protein
MLQTPWSSFCMGTRSAPSRENTTSLALGSRKRKVTLRSGWTSGDWMGGGCCPNAEMAAAANKNGTTQFMVASIYHRETAPPVNASSLAGRNNGRDRSKRDRLPTWHGNAEAAPSNPAPRRNARANRRSHRSTHSQGPVRNRPHQRQAAMAEVLLHSSRHEQRNRPEKVTRIQVLKVPVSYAPFLHIETRDARGQLRPSSGVNVMGKTALRAATSGLTYSS